MSGKSDRKPALTVIRSVIIAASKDMKAMLIGNRSHTSRPLSGAQW